jgi:hypothetical protein
MSSQYQQYLTQLRAEFTKIARLEFLNSDGTVAYVLDNNATNRRSGAFLQSGTISCNKNNGKRRQASVTLVNLDDEYEYAVNHIWFGQQIRLSEGIILDDGTEYYIPQGVFVIENPQESLKPGQKTVTYNLVDKWANIDGSLGGNLEDVHQVLAGTNIFDAMSALLKDDKYGNNNVFGGAVDGYLTADGTLAQNENEWMTSGYIEVVAGVTYTYTEHPTTSNYGSRYMFFSDAEESSYIGTYSSSSSATFNVTAPSGANYIRIGSRYLQNGGWAEFRRAGTVTPIDPVAPLFTDYYNGRTQTLTDGSVVSLIEAPHDFLSESTGTMADVLLGLNDMIAGDIGYNAVGRLVVNPSQDDILDTDKPIMWQFTEEDKTFLGADYSPKPTDVYNDVIVVGATSDTNETARGRAQNRDPSSATCISRIGMKTIRIEMPNYYSDQMCQDYADWQLKRYSVLSKEVTISCTQLFHIVENELITVQRTDKVGGPIERHLVTGFSRPIGQTGAMTINCVSVNDIPLSFTEDTNVRFWWKNNEINNAEGYA